MIKTDNSKNGQFSCIGGTVDGIHPEIWLFYGLESIMTSRWDFGCWHITVMYVVCIPGAVGTKGDDSRRRRTPLSPRCSDNTELEMGLFVRCSEYREATGEPWNITLQQSRLQYSVAAIRKIGCKYITLLKIHGWDGWVVVVNTGLLGKVQICD